MASINFEEVMGNNTFVLSGKQKGINTRQKYNLDVLDKASDPVEIIIPNGLEIITPSFGMGMFSASVISSGTVDKFFKKYHFKASPQIIEQIMDVAKASLVVNDPFANLS